MVSLEAGFRPLQILRHAADETYQERDRLRLLVQFRKAFIDRLLAEGEDAAEATAGDLPPHFEGGGPEVRVWGAGR